MILRFLKMSFVTSVVLILSSCADISNVPNAQTKFKTIPHAERASVLNHLTFWRAYGVFSIKQGKKAEIANFSWDQNGSKEYRILISSALNLYQIEILKRFGSITLWKNGTIATTAKTPEKLMQNAIGWSLPVADLYCWIRGIAAPGKSQATYDRFGHLQTLQQNGWALYYTSYRTADDIDLPEVMTVSRPGMTVKIVVREWHQFMRHFSVPEMK